MASRPDPASLLVLARDVVGDLTSGLPRSLDPAQVDLREMDLLYPPILVFARGFFLALGLQTSVSGSDHVPRSGGAVMAINHTSYIDFPFAGLAARPSNRLVRFMAKESTFRHRVSGPIMRGLHHIPVDREAGAGALEAAVDSLRAGEIIGVYPETTISRSWEIKPLKTGAVRMAKEAGVPILPTVIWGAHRIWTKGRPRDFGRNGYPVLIEVGQPIEVSPGDDNRHATQHLRTEMRTILHRLQETYPDRPGPDEDPWWLPHRMGGSAPTLTQAEEMDAEEREARRAARDARESSGTVPSASSTQTPGSAQSTG